MDDSVTLRREETGAVARVTQYPEAARIIALARRFAGIVRRGGVGEPGDREAVVAAPTAWLAEARACGVPDVCSSPPDPPKLRQSRTGATSVRVA
jgi:hypothetical protein